MRYVLAWNSLEDQRNILKEIARICNGIAIIQHQGADSADPSPLQKASTQIFSGEIPVLKRSHGYFTESKQIEKWMDELGLSYEKIQEKKVETLSETFIEKFKLEENDSVLLKQTLSGCDYINQSTYVVKFNLDSN